MKEHENTFIDANILTVKSGTNCPQGGDSGHGGRTIVRWKNEGGTDWWVNITRDSPDDVKTIEQPSEVEIVLGGDAEAETFIKSLEYTARKLRKQIKENKK